MESILWIGFIIPLICGILVGNDAEQRGMNGFVWGTFVFLFLIVGLPIYALLREPKKEEK